MSGRRENMMSVKVVMLLGYLIIHGTSAPGWRTMPYLMMTAVLFRQYKQYVKNPKFHFENPTHCRLVSGAAGAGMTILMTLLTAQKMKPFELVGSIVVGLFVSPLGPKEQWGNQYPDETAGARKGASQKGKGKAQGQAWKGTPARGNPSGTGLSNPSFASRGFAGPGGRQPAGTR